MYLEGNALRHESVAGRERKDSRRSQGSEKYSEIDGIEEDRHRLVPAEDDEEGIYPHWDLGNTAHDRSLGLDVIGVCVSPELGHQVDLLGLGENDKRSSKVEFTFPSEKFISTI
jgi:hypothetical protein